MKRGATNEIVMFSLIAAIVLAASGVVYLADKQMLSGGLSAYKPAGIVRACRREFFTLGTIIEATVYARDEDAGKAALDAVEAVFERVHSRMGRFEAGGDIYRVNSEEQQAPVKVGAETFYLLKRAIEYCGQSGGAFDIGLGAVSDLWGFVPYGGESPDSGEAPGESPDSDEAPGDSPAGGHAIPSPEELAASLKAGGYGKIVLDEAGLSVSTPPGMAIDLGAIAKGYAVQEAVSALKDAGIESALINAGGNVYAVGKKPPVDISVTTDAAGTSSSQLWKIGIRHPRPDGAGEHASSGVPGILAVISVSDTAVVTSGDYERYFELDGVRYHHIIDPATGWPAAGMLSVTVVSEDSVLADYLSTAIFVLGKEKGLALAARYPGVEAFIVDAGMDIAATPGFNAYNPVLYE